MVTNDRVLKNPHEYRGFVQTLPQSHSLHAGRNHGFIKYFDQARAARTRQQWLPRGHAQKENITWQLE